MSVAEVCAEAGVAAAKNQTASKARINGRRIIVASLMPLGRFPASRAYLFMIKLYGTLRRLP
jgi:hypothetical protein